MPIRRRSLRTSACASCTSTPSKITRPPSISSSALAQRSRVDLPEPLGPIRQTTSPRFHLEGDAGKRLERAVALDDAVKGEDRGAAPPTRGRSGATAGLGRHSATLKRRCSQSTSFACGITHEAVERGHRGQHLEDRRVLSRSGS